MFNGNIIGTNLLTKFHEDRKINVASRVLTKKNAPPLAAMMNLLTKFHKDRTLNVASRVLTRFYYSHIRKNAPPLGSHFFQANIIIFELIQDIIETNLLTKFHEDWTINVASRVLTRKNAPPLFHDDRKRYVTSRVLTSGNALLLILTIFQLNCHIQKTHVLTKFHEHWTKNVTSRGFTYINETSVLTKFHDDWAKIVTSRVFTRNTAPPPGGHVFQRTRTIFEHNQHIIMTNILTNFKLSLGINRTNVLTKFNENQTINVASRVFIRQNVDDARQTKGDHKSSP
ncbi:hypothetical protein DPMN_004412 [Dreissena polymorpha]|uniref:Uncharacterized protein n=1 Tax=Dreissena polymorpha TaxID=45954 RepID=A0A9D4MSM1_DREPO|nr:hypothetical protein DPMN_004412 [Dreissena polymorpha]